MSRILVTGGAGFIGSHICDALLALKHEVLSLDDKRRGVDYTPLGVERIQCELRCGYPSSYTPPDVVIHAAARADVASNWDSTKERVELLSTNIEGTANLLESIPRSTPVIFLSTGAVYGDNLNASEFEACVATSPYAASKLAGEAFVQAYAEPLHAPWYVFRLGCVVGPRYHHGHVLDFVAAAKRGFIRPKSDGRASKSFVHVLDVVQAVSMAVRGELPSGVYNVATGSWSPRDTVRVMRAEVDWPENKTHGWVGDPIANLSTTRLRNNGWRPMFSVESGIKQALEGLGWASK